MRDRILIDKSLIPYSFEIELGGYMYTFVVKYNSFSDLFTLTLYKDKTLICTEPLMYGKRLFEDFYIVGKHPAVDIVPLDESGKENTITWENFGETVFLTIDNGE